MCVIFVCLSVGCGGVQQEDNFLTEDEAKRALRQLPYLYKFRPVVRPSGADSAVAGFAIGPRKTKLNFGIAFGRLPSSVPVPRVGTDEVLSYRGNPPFVFY
jgi:hypothetical protein